MESNIQPNELYFGCTNTTQHPFHHRYIVAKTVFFFSCIYYSKLISPRQKSEKVKTIKQRKISFVKQDKIGYQKKKNVVLKKFEEAVAKKKLFTDSKVHRIFVKKFILVCSKRNIYISFLIFITQIFIIKKQHQ